MVHLKAIYAIDVYFDIVNNSNFYMMAYVPTFCKIVLIYEKINHFSIYVVIQLVIIYAVNSDFDTHRVVVSNAHYEKHGIEDHVLILHYC